MARRPNKQSDQSDSVRRRKMRERKERQEEEQSGPAPLEGEVRLNRFIAQAGLCSRRTADEWIAAGRVQVNGMPTTELGTKIHVNKDVVTVDGRPIHPQALTYVVLNKPRDTITTTDDERDRRTVMDLLDKETRASGVVPVGRLDRDTTGVLLLTNDGELAHRLMHPRYEIEKLYQVEVDKPVTKQHLQELASGVELEDGIAKADQVGFIGSSSVVGISLHEGRNRQIRRMFETLGYSVVKLDRVSYAGITTEGIRSGRWRELKPHEVNRLRRSVKLKTLVF